jgi:ribosomal protein S18 acetylase RimI-like enzyme
VAGIPALVIRPAAPSDGAFIRELAPEAFGEYSADAARQTAHMAAKGHALVAMLGDAQIGFAVVDVSFGRAHLAAIAVHVDSRGTGVGKALLGAAEALARSKGAGEMDLATADSNLAALELFLRSGYQRRRRHQRYYARGQHAIEMYKRL